MATHIYRGAHLGRAPGSDKRAEAIRTDPTAAQLAKQLLERMHLLNISDTSHDAICSKWAATLIQRVEARIKKGDKMPRASSYEAS
jgi:hypothetical protein